MPVNGQIDEDYVRKNIKKVISLPTAKFRLNDDPNLTKPVDMSSWKIEMTKCVHHDMTNIARNVLNQKSSNLCVPIAVSILLRYAIQNDLGIDLVNDDVDKMYTVE